MNFLAGLADAVALFTRARAPLGVAPMRAAGLLVGLVVGCAAVLGFVGLLAGWLR